ncbi:stage II sporulation protein M [Desulfofalx alkaliphila]|uniref:stage II sporulation protein M n=1 Tax=Desulfofalx alkaliphila TaxID=105483 RepID=UPI0004E11A9B|nr:stage II sporulation protein M [Desulfofalx alkaliphila]
MSGSFCKVSLASLRANWLLFGLVMLVFSAGSCLGVLGVDFLKTEQAKELSDYLESFIKQTNALQIDSKQTVKLGIANNVAVLAIIYFAGLTVLGLPLVLALIFVRGFALGFAFAFLTKQRAWEGALLAAASMLPHNIFFIPALIIGAMSSIAFSILLVKRYFNSRLAVWPAFLGYTLLMTALCTVAVGAAFVEAYITPWFIKGSAMLFRG